MWSSNTPQPTEQEAAEFSPRVIALSGCLHRAGLADVTVAQVNEVVNELDSDCKVDDFIKKLQLHYGDKPGLDLVISELAEESSKVQLAFLGVMHEKTKPLFKYATAGRNFETIGMSQTYNGGWLINDIIGFKLTQNLGGHIIPSRVLVPKYLK
ncbi:hypothetical protein GGI07_004836 [Coemansia sp. Benny D115]|nr:hypothetical protein GGI07_004836 [Coemansia sp. Benny D115]